MVNTTVWKKIDASGQILGRLCSQVAKLALLGEHIVVVNAKNAVISGNRNSVIRKYVKLLDVRTRTNPRRGPFHNTRPDTFLRQRIRFMLPKNSRGKKALSKIHVYINDIPKSREERYGKVEEISVPKASADKLSHGYVTVEDICYQIGWTGSSREVARI